MASNDRIYGVLGTLAVKPPCASVSTTNITLSGEQTVGGIALVEGHRCLVTGQTDQTTNGIYVVSTTAWIRAADFDGGRDVIYGTLVIVAKTGELSNFYECYSPNPIVIGTSNLLFRQVYARDVTYAITAAETAAGVTIVDDSIEPGNILRYGAVSGGAGDYTDAIQAAIDQCAEQDGSAVFIPRGNFPFASTLGIYTGITIRGEGIDASVLEYTASTGSGISNNTGARVNYCTFSDFEVECTHASGSTGKGLELRAVSYSSIIRVHCRNFATAHASYSMATSLWSIANRYQECRGSANTTGVDNMSLAFQIGSAAEQSSNAHILHRCRASNSTLNGIKVYDANEVHIHQCTMENNGTGGSGAGVLFDTASSYTGNCFVTECRFENNNTGTTKWLNIQTGCEGIRIRNNYILSTNGAHEDNGDYTQFSGNRSGDPVVPDISISRIDGDENYSYLFERTNSGGAGANAAFRVYDSVTSTGTPVTLQVQSERVGTTSRAFEVLNSTANASAKVFGIRGDGVIYTNQTVADASVTPANVVAKMPIYNEAGTLVGYIPIYTSI